jgi:hypothetical protein
LAEHFLLSDAKEFFVVKADIPYWISLSCHSLLLFLFLSLAFYRAALLAAVVFLSGSGVTASNTPKHNTFRYSIAS